MLKIDINERPRIEDLEALPKIRPYITEFRFDIREYQLSLFHRRYTARMAEVKEMEAKLRDRERQLDEREKELTLRETRLRGKENIYTSYTPSSNMRRLSLDPKKLT
jgi:hypothetical protein